MDYDFLKDIPGAIPKPEPRKRVKARADRQEAAVEKSVRGKVDDRDGFCRVAPSGSERLYQLVGSCEGVSEWAHLQDKRRARTRGMEPEERHGTGGTAKMCTRHHRAYDSGMFHGAFLTQRGADGPMIWFNSANHYTEGL